MASSSPARPRARETASFMKPTWRRTAWPSEAAFCSARRSGSAKRMATSVMVEERRRSSSVRQARMAISHSSAIGTMMAAMVRKVVGRASSSSQPTIGAALVIEARMKAAPRPPQTMLAMPANLYGALDGFCCRAKIRPPMLGPSSLAAMRLREGPAARRRAMRRRGATSVGSISSSGVSRSAFSAAGNSGVGGGVAGAASCGGRYEAGCRNEAAGDESTR